MRDIIGYQLSRDYHLLAALARQQSVVCVVDYHDCRDVAQTLYEEHRGQEAFQISARGMGYIYSAGEKDFVAACESANCEFIPPHR